MSQFVLGYVVQMVIRQPWQRECKDAIKETADDKCPQSLKQVHGTYTYCLSFRRSAVKHHLPAPVIPAYASYCVTPHRHTINTCASEV